MGRENGAITPRGSFRAIWRAHPEVPFAVCLAFFWVANYTSFGNTGWAPWSFQELTLQRIPDPVLPFTLAATVATFGILLWTLHRPVGVLRAALVAVSIPLGAVGFFELLFQFLFNPANFWVPAHLNLAYWGYAFAILSFALFGLVGAGWWVLNRAWWALLAATAAALAFWSLIGLPLPVSPLDGHVTPSWELGIALVINVGLKWAVFALLTVPVLNGVHGAFEHK